MIRVALLFTGLLVAAPAVAADQFDLICTAKRATEHYRIDLAAGEYCWGLCDRVEKISAVTSGVITLMDIKPQRPGDMEAHKTVNRSTGAWEWYSYSRRYDVAPSVISGSCEPTNFSGFPARKF